jgi:hypothetical protein
MTRQQQREAEWLRKLAVAARLRRIFKADDESDGADVEDEADDATVEAALHYLIHTPHGAAALRRAFPSGAGSADDIEGLARLVARQWRRHARAKEPDADPFQPWADIVGEADTNKGTAPMESIKTICKCIGDSGQSWLSEQELTEKIFDHAQLSRRDGESPHQAFARVFGGNTPEGLAFRKAVAVAKALPGPEQVGGRDATDVNDPEKALAQLRDMVAELRRHAHHLTESQLWDRAIKERPSLAKRACAS